MPGYDHTHLRTSIAAAASALSDNAIAPALVAAAIGQGGARLTGDGALVVETGAFTGRSPKDKFIVQDGLTQDRVWWDNSGAITPDQFDALLEDITAHLAGQALCRQDLLAGADSAHQ